MRVFQRPKNCPRVGGPRRDRIRREVLVDLRIYTMGGVLRRVYTSASNSSPRAPHLMSKKECSSLMTTLPSDIYFGG
jgi:hypothetical protein